MRRTRRAAPVLMAAALMVLVPTVSPGGVIIKGPFEIDPTSAEPDTDFTLFVSGEDCAPLFAASGPSGREPEAVLLTVPLTTVHVQVIGPRPSDTVQASEDYTPDPSGDWSSPPTIPLNLPEGDYLVSAECQHPGFVDSESADSTASTGQDPAFVLLGEEEPAMCHEGPGISEPPFDPGPGCYEPQELVIAAEEAGPAEAEEEEPTFTG